MSEQPLISISEASLMLGVSETTLRQWTDEGRIKAFVTPGGHRRYSRTDLKKFVGSHHKTLGIKDLVAELEDTIQLHRDISRAYLNSTAWYNKLSRESQEQLAHGGRQLLQLVIRYITEPSRREEIVQMARDVGSDHAKMLAERGLPLTDAVEAFIIHRAPLMEAATHLMKKREVLSGRVVEAVPLVARIMDEALVSLVAAHQQYQKRSDD